jgi:hypothetical protein
VAQINHLRKADPWDVEEHGESIYLAMECIEGLFLKEAARYMPA